LRLRGALGDVLVEATLAVEVAREANAVDHQLIRAVRVGLKGAVAELQRERLGRRLLLAVDWLRRVPVARAEPDLRAHHQRVAGQLHATPAAEAARLRGGELGLRGQLEHAVLAAHEGEVGALHVDGLGADLQLVGQQRQHRLAALDAHALGGAQHDVPVGTHVPGARGAE
jgi:hypothetical protein